MKKLLTWILMVCTLVCFAACAAEGGNEKPNGNGAQSGGVGDGAIELPEDKFD